MEAVYLGSHTSKANYDMQEAAQHAQNMQNPQPALSQKWIEALISASFAGSYRMPMHAQFRHLENSSSPAPLAHQNKEESIGIGEDPPDYATCDRPALASEYQKCEIATPDSAKDSYQNSWITLWCPPFKQPLSMINLPIPLPGTQKRGGSS